LGTLDAGQSWTQQRGHETGGSLSLFSPGNPFQARISGPIGIRMAQGAQ
jgi:hypothetical protein